ncbi:MAG: hypothetical protein ACFB11_22780, partial [Paracoccaceae bacterium]
MAAGSSINPGCQFVAMGYGGGRQSVQEIAAGKRRASFGLFGQWVMFQHQFGQLRIDDQYLQHCRRRNNKKKKEG